CADACCAAAFAADGSPLPSAAARTCARADANLRTRAASVRSPASRYSAASCRRRGRSRAIAGGRVSAPPPTATRSVQNALRAAASFAPAEPEASVGPVDGCPFPPQAGSASATATRKDAAARTRFTASAYGPAHVPRAAPSREATAGPSGRFLHLVRPSAGRHDVRSAGHSVAPANWFGLCERNPPLDRRVRASRLRRSEYVRRGL